MSLGNYKRYMVVRGTPCCSFNNKLIGQVFDGSIKKPDHADFVRCGGCRHGYNIADHTFVVSSEIATYLKSTVIELPGDVTDEYEEVSKELELQN